MAYRTRIYYSAAQKAEMWDRWQQGETLHSIARLFDRHHTSVRGILAATGGIRPPERRRSRLALTLAEREEISRGIACDLSLQAIATRLKRAPSTISREVRRNGGLKCYRASQADQAAWDRARRPKPCKLVINRALARIVAKKLRRFWSPEQIAGWLKQEHPEDESHQVSHETIYRSLFIQARGALKKELQQHLRTRRAMRRSRHKHPGDAYPGRVSKTRIKKKKGSPYVVHASNGSLYDMPRMDFPVCHASGRALVQLRSSILPCG
jgi:IS30 family transposase